MQTTALVRISSPGPTSHAHLRALREATRWASRQPGFRGWQTFRAMDPSGAILALIDWDSGTSLERAAADPWLQDIRNRIARNGSVVSPVEVLPQVFDRRISPGDAAATLIRVSRTVRPQRASLRDREFALQALAAPGSVATRGAQDATAGVSVCRLDFELEDGLWHFLESPLRMRWSGAAQGEEEETWAINLPRFEELPLRPRPGLTPVTPLAMQLSVDERSHRARVRLEGRIDLRGSEHCEKVCRSLLEGGCRTLELDLSELQGISAEALAMLTRTARYLKQHGGEFIVIDNATRVRRVARTKHLEASLG
ncbi:MAG: STAS domain-containing protein [Armatimonadota bacterium]